MTRPYLTTSQAARRLGLSRYTILRAAQRGEIAVAQRTPKGWFRFEPTAVDAYAQRLRERTPSRTPHPARATWLDAVYETMACGVLVRDAAGVILDANAAAQQILGRPLDHLRGQPLVEAIGAATHPDGTPLALEERPTIVAARTGQPQRGVVLQITRPDGQHRCLHLDAVPLPHPAGAGPHVVVSFLDITARVRAEAALRQSAERFRALSEHATDLVAVTDAAGLMRYASPSYHTVLGYTPAELEGTPALDLVHPDDRAGVAAGMRRRAAAEGSVGRVAFRVRHRDGSWRTLDVTTNNRLHDPAVRGIVTVGRDETARAQAEAALRASEALFRGAFDEAAVGMAVQAPDGRYLRVNPALCRFLGYSAAELLATTWQALTHPDDVAPGERGIAAVLAGQEGAWVTEKRYRHKEGHLVWGALSTAPVRGPDGPPRYFISQIQDIDARKRAEAELQRLALHDGLTGLPNRTLLHDRLGQALAAAAREGTPLALGLLDLDRFKEVNDTLGHAAGDALLQEVARRLAGTLRASDTVARLGGDEFALLLPGAERASAVATLRKLLAGLAAPVTLDGQTVIPGGSVGLALSPADGVDAATLLRHADVAMYTAKRGGSGLALYSAAQDQHSPRRLTLIGALQRGIAEGELRLHYQPTVDVESGQVRLVEALVRWQHPEQGLLLPEHFIPLAEQTGLIVPLTRWVLETAVRQVRAWRGDGLDLGVAVNLSTRVLHDPDLPTTIAALLAAHDVPAVSLRVELTESMVMADPAQALAVLIALHRLGVRIAIDDFGTGYSSLAYLKRLPIDEIKIDKSFVTSMATDSEDATIVASTIGLGHSLGLRFVAEGVETRAALDQLAALGCDSVQGFYVSRPVPPDELAHWLRARRRPSRRGRAPERSGGRGVG